MKEQDLLLLKKKIDDAKNDVAELRGRHKHLLDELKTEWDCKDIDAAEKKLVQLKKDQEKLEKSIEEAVSELQDKYEIND